MSQKSDSKAASNFHLLECILLLSVHNLNYENENVLEGGLSASTLMGMCSVLLKETFDSTL